jgi:hypothetical protein
MPNPALAGYGPARDRFDHWRGYASPLGNVSPVPWGTPPAGLKPEFRLGRPGAAVCPRSVIPGICLSIGINRIQDGSEPWRYNPGHGIRGEDRAR